MNQIHISKGSRTLLVHDNRHEPADVARARRAAAHPGAEIVNFSTVSHPFRGARGGVAITVELFVPTEVFADAEIERGPLEKNVGDAGGAGDQLIAEAARKLTGLADPVEVAQALAEHYVTKIEDLWTALKLGPGDVISDETRAKLGEVLGFVEPCLPEWVVPGALVVDRWRRVVERVDAVDMERASVNIWRAAGGRWVPSGIFLRSHHQFDVDRCEDAHLLCMAAEALGLQFDADVGFDGLKAKAREAIHGPPPQAGWEPDATCDPGEKCVVCGENMSAPNVGFAPILRRDEPYGRAHRGCVTGHVSAEERHKRETIRKAHLAIVDLRDRVRGEPSR